LFRLVTGRSALLVIDTDGLVCRWVTAELHSPTRRSVRPFVCGPDPLRYNDELPVRPRPPALRTWSARAREPGSAWPLRVGACLDAETLQDGIDGAAGTL
jgi:hypothetical protein